MSAFDFIGRQLGGWRLVEPAKTYNRETIFDYIDGAGEVYRLYAFREVFVADFIQAGAEPFTVEVFDMGSAGDAYGIFTFYHEGEDVDIGQGAYLRPGLLSFWQDKYFVCVSTKSGTDPAQEKLAGLARAVAAVIPGKGNIPGWLKLFPDKNRRAQSLRYFHNHASLNYHYFLAEKNILRLDDSTQCALARYQVGKEDFSQLWVRYPDSSAARAGYAHFMENYMPAGKSSGMAHDKKKKWTTAVRHDRYVALAFDVSTKATADSVKQAVEHILREGAK